jgi:hypothetical protein
MRLSLGAVAEPEQAEEVLRDAFAVVLEAELADPENGDLMALQPRVLPVVALAVGRQHVVALAVGLGHHAVIGPVEAKLPAAEVDVALWRRDSRVGRDPVRELTLEPGLVGGVGR